jgi:carbamoyltransferase
LLKDGVIIAAVNDERLIREKMALGFPRKSISEVIKLGGIKPNDIDYVAVATQRQHLINKYVDYRGGKFGYKRGFAKQVFFEVGAKLSKLINFFPFLETLYYLLRQPFYIYRRLKVKKILSHEFNIKCPVEFIDHHFCHATSAYYSSKFEDATVITLDSAGDGLSSQVYQVTDGKFAKLSKVSSFNSPCAFYSYVTEICGFKAGKHEGKITGLAAYGKPSYIDVFKKLINYQKGTFRNIGGIFLFSALKALKDLLPEDFTREDLACTIQHYSEEMATDYIRYWVGITGKTNIALAGGLFANVKINQKIYDMPEISSIFIHQGMSDEGIGVGAALALYYSKAETNMKRKVCMNHVYLGPEFSTDEIKREIDSEGLTYEFHEDVEKEIARLLASGYVVARFEGRMEYGPRALGNRSILYQTTDPSANEWLNKCLVRTEFMPFAPATLIEDAEECYIGIDGAKDAARFMTITFDCKEFMKDNCPGVVHIDGTARPQLVDKDDNPSFYRIIKEYKKLTGVGSIINTSYNMHEEPIVCTPGDAIRAFKLGHLDYLAIGNCLVKSRYEIKHHIVHKKPEVSIAT